MLVNIVAAYLHCLFLGVFQVLQQPCRVEALTLCNLSNLSKASTTSPSGASAAVGSEMGELRAEHRLRPGLWIICLSSLFPDGFLWAVVDKEAN